MRKGIWFCQICVTISWVSLNICDDKSGSTLNTAELLPNIWLCLRDAQRNKRLGFVVLKTAKSSLSTHQFTSGFLSRVLANADASPIQENQHYLCS
jgi:hypothetical protein